MRGKFIHKFLVFAAAIAMCAFLCSCGKSKAVMAVEEQISNIGEVNDDSLDAIEAAESLYGALKDGEKNAVENYTELQTARTEYDSLIADKVIALIDGIGDVAKSSEREIKKAEDAFARLTDSQKALVSNYAALQSARNTHNNILIAEVEELIRAVQYDGGDPSEQLLTAVRSAQTAYSTLAAELKPQVKNYAEFEASVDAIYQYAIQKTRAAIDQAIETDEGYEEADKLYRALTSVQKAKIANYSEFTASYEAYKNKPPLELISYRLGKNLIGQPKFYLQAKNMTDNIIKEFTIFVFAYDSDGVPVTVSLTGDYSEGLQYSKAVKAGEETDSHTYGQLYGTYENMKQFVVILRDVEFFDGTTWENSQYSTLFEKYEQQLLETDDKNILPRA